jgi:hypothetical protein
MPINRSFLGEFGHELQTTRKVISGLPDDNCLDELDLAPPGGPKGWQRGRSRWAARREVGPKRKTIYAVIYDRAERASSHL